MKLTRFFVAALALVLTVAACDSMPTAPTAGEPVQNLNPLIGSGVGGG